MKYGDNGKHGYFMLLSLNIDSPRRVLVSAYNSSPTFTIRTSSTAILFFLQIESNNLNREREGFSAYSTYER